VTKADKIASNLIVSGLRLTNLPVLSEEGLQYDYEQRAKWPSFWLVDPLDGTREFIKKNGEFTVNIALIENGTPTFGVVYVPVTDTMFIGGENFQGIKIQSGTETKLKEKLSATTLKEMRMKDNIRVVASRSYLNDKTQEFLSNLINPEIIAMGSSLKFMSIVDGQADIYPRFAPTMEWDTAASHAILNSLGYKLYHENLAQELTYNKKNLLNPGFICY
jgi:3'(2'), 5'-bisphosphate nucleotidase